MTTCRSVLLALLLALVWSTLPAATARAEGWQPRPELLVSGEWLVSHGRDVGLRVVDLRDPTDYAQGHIPGAVNLPGGALFASVDGVAGMLPPLERIATLLGQAGIASETTAVGYDDAGGLYAARLFWVLDYLGSERGRLLDGGWQLWVQRGRPVATQEMTAPGATFTPRPRPERLADLAWVRAHLDDPTTVLVDARSMLEYRGITRYARYGGHIPGAVSLEWKRHLNDDGTMRSPAELRAEYEALGVTPDREAAVYCQVMVRAAHSYFTLRWLGLPRLRAYDGSWAEWGNRDDTPKERL